MSKRITPVILSGGAGTRLWPLSRLGRPKQLLPLGADGDTLLQATARRASDPERFAAPVLVAAADHAEEIERQLGEIEAAPARLILEPDARGTAAAIALAALSAEPDELLLVMPSDHVVRAPEAFRAAVERALPLAEADRLVTFGISPERPETGYGYIRSGEPLGEGVFAAEAFVEKPDRATAEAYLLDGRYLWNGGIFLFRAEAFLDELEAFEPDILSAARAALAAQKEEAGRIWPDARCFARAPSRSIDHAVMERSARVAVVPVEMGWSDIGSWDALHGIGDKDADGNVLTGDVVAIDSHGCLIRSDGPVIVTIGAEDLVVVATERAVLVAPRGQSQRVREAIEALQQRERNRSD
jgi:mannose-1-phosphate guanylyltransferase